MLSELLVNGEPAGVQWLVAHRYQVLKPLPVQGSEIAPAFGQTGGGVQMLSRVLVKGEPASVRWLVDQGYLKEIPR